MRELISRLVVGLFSVNDTGFRAVAALLMIAEAVLSHLVILKVNCKDFRLLGHRSATGGLEFRVSRAPIWSWGGLEIQVTRPLI